MLTSIQEDDFVPLLDMHYALLSKSKYGIVRDYTINFKEIDTPTEKERAEINSMEATTAATLVNAGVLSPEEVRDKLIKDPDSGFNDITDELPEDDEPFNFGDEPTDNGGSSNEQNPFIEDEFNLDAWNEEDHPRNKEGEFTNGNGSNSNKSETTKNDNFEQDVEKVFESIKNKGDNRVKVDVGEVSEKLTNEAKKNGFDITGYKHNVDVSGVQHAFKHHGIGNEVIRGQIPITEEDIKKIPDIVYNYDKVTFGTKDAKGTDVIKYQKQMSDGEIYYLEEIRTGKKSLTIKSMYKKSR